MIAAIHQPNFLPWLGYFYKMSKCDCFIFLDDVQFVRRGYTNRVKIKNPEGGQWLSVPVQKKGRFHQSVSEVELEPGDQWKHKTLGTLQTLYGKTPFFHNYFPKVEKIIQQEHRFLADMNIQLIRWLALVLKIDTPTTQSSQLEQVTGQSTERLISICQAVKADRYLSGFGGQKYQEQELFQAAGIDLVVYDFHHPHYLQRWEPFTGGLSTLDLIFNCGPGSADILKKCSNGASHEL